MQIPIDRHDRVISAFQFRDYVLVVTETGAVFQIFIQEDMRDDNIRIVSR